MHTHPRILYASRSLACSKIIDTITTNLPQTFPANISNAARQCHTYVNEYLITLSGVEVLSLGGHAYQYYGI